MHRLKDYKELLRIELKLQGRGVGVQLLGYALALVFVFLAVIFVGVAIIVTAWDSAYRTEVAWLVVILYALLAAGSLFYVQHFHAENALSTLRGELRRDLDTLKESL